MGVETWRRDKRKWSKKEEEKKMTKKKNKKMKLLMKGKWFEKRKRK